MPPIRSAKHLCPVCLKGYNTDFWLDKHIDSDHPRYRQQLSCRMQPKPGSERTSSFTSPGVYNALQGEPLTPAADSFFDNHNAVDDPNALPSSAEIENISESQVSNTVTAPMTTETFPAAGMAVAYAATLDEQMMQEGLNDPYYPFGSEEEYNFAELVTLKGIPANVIDTMLKSNCGLDKGICASLKSNYHLRQKIDRMEDGLGHRSWKKSTLPMTWNEQHPDRIVFWHRDLTACAKWILRQPAYREHLVYGPVRSFNTEGKRIYDEMHTGDWWWDTQVLRHIQVPRPQLTVRVKSSLPVGDTVVPIIFMSDATHLTNFCGDKKAWPVYMTIGNLSAKARMQHTMHGVLLLALLPIPVKMREVPAKIRNAQREHNRSVVQNVLKHVMQDLLASGSKEQRHGQDFYTFCADGQVRHCHPILAAWMADYPEHCNLHNIKSGVCYWCECPQKEMGDMPRVEDRYPPRDHTLYRRLWEHGDVTELKGRSVNSGGNVLWYLKGVTIGDLPKPDLLHTMQIGMLKHLLGWLQCFLKQHKRLELFNNIWLSVPAYLDMSRPKCAYEEVSQWNGGEIKTMTRYLLGVTRNALRNPTAGERAAFESALECTRALVEFYMYCQYNSHDEDTLNLMEDALRHFHDTKDVFLQFRAGKRIAAEARERRTELCKERDAEMKANFMKSAAYRQRIQDTWKVTIETEMAEYIEEGADFNFPKIHLMLHFREQIQQFGSMRQWSTEIGESSHKYQIKDGFNSSNKTGDYYSQMINFYLRCDAFSVRRANREALSKVKKASESPVAVPVGGTTSGPAERNCRLKFISPQLQKGRQRVRDFQGLLGTITNEATRERLKNATLRFLGSRGIRIELEELQRCTAAIYHGLEVKTSNMHGEEASQRLRCTGEKGWYSGGARHDWIWVQIAKKRDGQDLPYKALQGRLPYRMLNLFKLLVKHPRAREWCTSGDSLRETFWLAYVELTKPANGGMPEKASRLVRVVKPTTGAVDAVISAGNILGAAHLIPEEPDCSRSENKGWIVNSHIDLATWNDIYYMYEDELEAIVRNEK